MNGSGHFKIDGGGHTMTWEDGNNYHFLGNFSPDADAVYIELTNINLVQQDIKSAVCVINGRITLGKDVALTMNGQYGDMIVAVGEKAVLELGEGFELSCTAVSSSCCVIVQEGATLVRKDRCRGLHRPKLRFLLGRLPSPYLRSESPHG